MDAWVFAPEVLTHEMLSATKPIITIERIPASTFAVIRKGWDSRTLRTDMRSSRSNLESLRDAIAEERLKVQVNTARAEWCAKGNKDKQSGERLDLELQEVRSKTDRA